MIIIKTHFNFSSARQNKNLLLLFWLTLLFGCASNPERGACGVLLKADRYINATVFDGDPKRTISAEQIAPNHPLACKLLNIVVLPYDLFCGRPFDHCNHWQKYKADKPETAEQESDNNQPGG